MNLHLKHQNSESGFALVAVLWGVVILSLIVLAFSADTRMEIKMVTNTIEHAQIRAMADGGVAFAIHSLLDPNSENRWSPDGIFREIKMDNVDLKVSVQDEGGKIDLNIASKELLQQLFSSSESEVYIDSSLADAIIDWRDENDLKQINGAEDSDYREAGLPYGAKDGPFESVRELRLVLGMTDEIFTVIQPAITVYSQQAEPDKSTAPDQVLKSMFDENEVEEILAERESAVESGEQSLNSKVGVYRIQSNAVGESGTAFSRYAIIRLTGNDEDPVWVYETGRSKIANKVLDDE
jgi:general secretion pathway protein K